MNVRRISAREFFESWTMKVGVTFLAILVVMSIFVIIVYPADFGKRVWSNPMYWADNPKLVPPAWITLLTGEKLPEHTIFKLKEPAEAYWLRDAYVLEYRVDFNYDYDDYYSFIHVLVRNITFYSSQPPRIEIYFSRPDGLMVKLTSFTVRGPSSMEEPPYQRYVDSPKRIILSEDVAAMTNLLDSLNEKYNITLSFSDILLIGTEKLFFGYPLEDRFNVLKGRYGVYIMAYFPNEPGNVEEIRLILGGKVFGLLGTDMLGRDLMAGLLYGLPVSLMIGFLAAILITSIGVSLGIMSGYLGGKVDVVIQRSSDILVNMPLLPILIFFTFILREFDARLILIILVLTAFSWPGLAIITRPIVMQMKSSQFIEAAISCGASSRWIMFKHILPNLAPFVLAQSIFTVPSAILAEAALSFLGLGDPTLPTWGQMLEYGFRSGAIYLGHWWIVIPPGLLIVLTAFIFVLIAFGMEPIVSPRLKRR